MIIRENNGNSIRVLPPPSPAAAQSRFWANQVLARRTKVPPAAVLAFVPKRTRNRCSKRPPQFRLVSHFVKVNAVCAPLSFICLLHFLVIFSNKSLKFQKSSSNIANYSQSAEGSKLVANTPKKTSMDDDFFSISSNSSKTRRSPLRFLGNLVDADKLFRGRWSSAKRAKSTDEITWALANEDLGTANNATSAHMLKDSGRTRKKSLGIMSTNSTSRFDICVCGIIRRY